MQPIIDSGIETQLELIDLLTHPAFLIFVIFGVLFLICFLEHLAEKWKKRNRKV